jgi:signal transduction histidine kinase
MSYRRTSLWLAPGLTAVTLLLGWGIARSVRRPLLTITRSAERIADGDLTRPMDEAGARVGGTEIARLASAFERMRRSLAASVAATNAAHEELERRVEDRTHALALANARLEERERQRQQLLRKLIAAQEDERKRVARELHDETSQTLAALAMAVDAAANTPGSHAGPLPALRGLVSRISDGIRRLIVDLRPSVLDDLGLAAAIQSFADAHLTRAGLAVRCEIDDGDLRLPSAVETAVFRAVQEALVNIERHALAQTVLIQVSIEGGTLAVDIEDDGVGFAPEAAVPEPDSLRGIGLLGMRERIELVGGSVRVESAPGEGTRVVMSVPIGQEAAHA